MTIWADITSGASKWRVRQIQQASCTERINRGDGKFTLSLPVYAKNADQFVPERQVTLYNHLGEFCSGYITGRNYSHSGGNPVWRISGESLMRELKWEKLNGVRIASTEWMTPPPRYHEHDFQSKWKSNRWQLLIDQYGHATASPRFARAIYIGAKSPIRSARITLKSTGAYDSNNISAGAFYNELYNGVQWVRVSNLAYTGSPTPFSVLTTTFTWDFAEDTRALFHDSQNNPFADKEAYFWIRLWPNQQIENINVAQVEVLVDSPEFGDVTEIMTYASGWAMSASYEAGTKNGTLQEFNGDSVMSALIATSEKSGEMFRKGAGRSVEWLHDPEDLGLRLIGGRGIMPNGVILNSSAALIKSIEDNEDSKEVITRIYAFGRGTGGGRPDMSKARDSVVNPILTDYGFTLDKANNCIVNASLETSLGGERPAEETFRDIGAMYNSGENSPQISEEIVKKAAAQLYERRQNKRTISVEVVGLPRRVKLAELVTIRYAEGSKQIFNEQFTVTEVKNTVSRSGSMTARLVLSNYHRPEESPFDRIAKEIRNSRYAERFDQAVSGKALQGAPPQFLG